jgi:hypothetical protein
MSPLTLSQRLDRFVSSVVPDSIERPLMNFAREQQKKGWGGLLEVTTPFGFAVSGLMPGGGRAQNKTAPYYGPAYGSAEALGLGTPGPSLRNYGPRYKERELAAGAAAERFRPGAGFPGQQGAADRAYQAELSRTSQLTAQDPELQRYEKARVGAKTQEEMDAVRDMGLQMWQQKYGATPMGQPGGAIGSFNPLMQQTFGYQTGMAPSQLGQTSAAAPVSPVGTGETQYQSGDLGTRAMLETGYDPAAYGISPEMIEEMQKRLLNQSAK